jgi:hypothetical protein
VLAVAVFLFAFAIYSVTAPPFLTGYEPETAAVTEGFVRTGEFRILEDSAMVPPDPGIPGKDGQIIGRVGLPQPVLEAPFYLAGWAVDEVNSGSDTYQYRSWTVLFYNPFVMAMVAGVIFLIMMRIHGCIGWSVAIALLFTVASLAWPYSKIGLDTTTTLGVALTFLGAVYARGSQRLWPWWVAGFGAGLATAAKPYAFPVVVVVAALMWPALRSAVGKRVRRLIALGAPFLAWMAGMAWYNWSRLGSVSKTGAATYEVTLAAPLNALGFVVSPARACCGIRRSWRWGWRGCRRFGATTAGSHSRSRPPSRSASRWSGGALLDR